MLGHLVGEPVEVQCAGRTDAGVHATGQVAHVDVPAASTGLDAQRLNRALPDDLRVRELAPAVPGFDARFSALWRRYSYRVCDDGLGPEPLHRHIVLPWSRPLDVDAMTTAAQRLVGEHDFAAFCKARRMGPPLRGSAAASPLATDRPLASTVRAIHELRWERDRDGLAVMNVRADAFCHSMVRSLVGVLLPVGDGRRPAHWPGDVLRAGRKDSAVTTMPAYPLVLEEVGYPADDQLAERQRQTRSLRSLATD